MLDQLIGRGRAPRRAQGPGTAARRRIRALARRWAPPPAVALVVACSQPSDAREEGSAVIELAPCALGDGPREALCARLAVPEAREGGGDASGERRIELAIMVVPARSRSPAPDPLFVLVGGPGQAASEVGPLMLPALYEVQATRDLVFVDQRGTGRSNPLDCAHADTDGLAELFRVDLDRDEVDRCLAALPGDPTRYTTPTAMEDLDEVRAALGYGEINLLGVSYGSRAALVYLRQHPERVRSLVLDGAAPVSLELPLHMDEDGARALDLLFDDCEQDEACAARFPDLRRRYAQLLERLAKQAQAVALVHPRTGEIEEVVIERAAVAAIVRGALYSGELSSLLPLALDRAAAGDYQQLAALASASRSTAESVSLGMFLAVTCSEDLAQIDAADRERHRASAADTSPLESLTSACEGWPRARLPEGYADPIRSDRPVLVLSGALDPATPPRWGDRVVETLANSRHVVVPGSGHGTWSQACVGDLVARFLATADPAALDAGCVDGNRRPRFFLAKVGPRAAAAAAATPTTPREDDASPRGEAPPEGRG